MPITSTPVAVTSPITAHTLVVPTSSPVMMVCVLRTSASLQAGRGRRHERGGIPDGPSAGGGRRPGRTGDLRRDTRREHNLVPEAEIDRGHPLATRVGFPDH